MFGLGYQYQLTATAAAGILLVTDYGTTYNVLVTFINEWEMNAISASHALSVVHYYNGMSLPAS